MSKVYAWASLALAAVLFTLTVWGGAALADDTSPPAGTINRTLAVTLYPSTTISGETTYSDSPNLTSGGLDVSRSADFNSADIFVTSSTPTTQTVVATVQVSGDGSNWATLQHEHFYTNSVVALDYSVTLTGTSATKLMRVPIAGQYLRVKLVAEAQATGVSVGVVYRNN